MIITSKENCIEAIKSIGQNLIDRAEDICNDLHRVSNITIYANITPSEIVNFDVTKNYIVNETIFKKRKNRKNETIFKKRSRLRGG